MVCIYNSFLLHLSASGHLGCFHVLTIVNDTAVNIGVHVSFPILVSSGCMPSSGIAGFSGSSVSSFLRNLDWLQCLLPLGGWTCQGPQRGRWDCPLVPPRLHGGSQRAHAPSVGGRPSSPWAGQVPWAPGDRLPYPFLTLWVSATATWGVLLHTPHPARPALCVPLGLP